MQEAKAKAKEKVARQGSSRWSSDAAQWQAEIRILGPKLVVTFGKEARSYFDPTPEHLGRTMEHVVLGTTVQVFLGNHVIMGGAAFWRDGGYEDLRHSANDVFRR